MLRHTAGVQFYTRENELTAMVGGEIDHHGAGEIRNSIDSEMQRLMPHTLVLDLSGVNFMDSSGLGLILGRYNSSAKLGITFKVKNPSPSADRIIGAAGVERIVKIERQQS